MPRLPRAAPPAGPRASSAGPRSDWLHCSAGRIGRCLRGVAPGQVGARQREMRLRPTRRGLQQRLRQSNGLVVGGAGGLALALCARRAIPRAYCSATARRRASSGLICWP